MAVRFILIAAGRCSPRLDERFDDGRPLDPQGVAEVEAAAGRFRALAAAGLRYCSPSPRARHTGGLLGLTPLAQPALRDIDMDRWAGVRLDQVMAREPQAVAAWLEDPRRTPYGGEPLPAFVARVGGWLETRPQDAGDVVAVLDPGVLRAAVVYALGAPPQVFWRTEAFPLAAVSLAGERGTWAVRLEP